MKKNSKKGIALIEVVIALILLTSYIVFNTGMYYTAYTNVRHVQNYTVATNILIEATEQVKAQSYEEVVGWLDTIETPVYTFDVSVLVNTETYNSFEYKVANITVSWGDETMRTSVLKYNPPIFTEVTE